MIRQKLVSIAGIALTLPLLLPFAFPADVTDLPVVVSAEVPFYPLDARLAHIQGEVRLRLSIKGENVSSVQLLEGQITLARAAEENVKTWRFRWHDESTFDITFRYTLLPQFSCVAENPTVLLQLPVEVKVSAKGLKTCDPVVDTEPKKNPPK